MLNNESRTRGIPEPFPVSPFIIRNSAFDIRHFAIGVHALDDSTIGKDLA